MNQLGEFLNRRWVFVLFMTLVAIWFCLWAFFIVTTFGSSLGAPDEGLRYLVPKFIFENGRLPTGYDAATIHTMGNWSYAFYPQFLGPLVSAFFMTIVSFFSSAPDTLIIAARMTSVLFGVGTVFFTGLAVKKLFQGNKNAVVLSFVAMILVAAWPQVAFLSAYVNNDIVALCGVSIVLFACISGLKDQWNIKNALVFAVGIIVCLLGYNNSYGFVLFGGVFFLGSLWWQFGLRRHFFAVLGVAMLIVATVAGPFFVRNAIIYDGDVTGLATFRERTLAWESETGKQAQRSYAELKGGGLSAIATDKDYSRTQTNSSIARFGKMTIAPDEKYMNVYRSMVVIGSIGCLWMLGDWCARHVRRRGNLGTAAGRYKEAILLVGCVTAACVVTIGLSLYYSLMIDYQAQGRYVIYLLLPLVIVSVAGFNFLIQELIVKRYRGIIALALVGLYGATSLIVYYKYVYWVGMPHMWQ